ncbi:hypothetical protein BASA81_010592 [Batrachochytrium salamandrivorans]|nr:hypothetical protein BASA81_010592 [Batrachochytrium salamandrivorans]
MAATTNQEALNITRALFGLILDRLGDGADLGKFLSHQREYKEWQRVRDRHVALFTITSSRWDRIPLSQRQALLDLICFELLPTDLVVESGFYLLGEEVQIQMQLSEQVEPVFDREERDELACLKTLSLLELCLAGVDKWRAKFPPSPAPLPNSPWIAEHQTKIWLKLNALVIKGLGHSRIKFANELVHKMQLILHRLPRRTEGHLDSLFSLYALGDKHQNTYLCQLVLQAIKRLAIGFEDHYTLIQACHLPPTDMQLLKETCAQNSDFAKSANIYLLEQKRYADLLFDFPQAVEQAVQAVRPDNAKELLWLCYMSTNDRVKAAQALLDSSATTKRAKTYDSLAFLCQFVGNDN